MLKKIYAELWDMIDPMIYALVSTFALFMSILIL